MRMANRVDYSNNNILCYKLMISNVELLVDEFTSVQTEIEYLKFVST